MSTLNRPPAERDLPSRGRRRTELLHLLDLNDGVLETTTTVRRRWLMPAAAAMAVAAAASGALVLLPAQDTTSSAASRPFPTLAPSEPGKAAAIPQDTARKIFEHCINNDTGERTPAEVTRLKLATRPDIRLPIAVNNTAANGRNIITILAKVPAGTEAPLPFYLWCTTDDDGASALTTEDGTDWLPGQPLSVDTLGAWRTLVSAALGSLSPEQARVAGRFAAPVTRVTLDYGDGRERDALMNDGLWFYGGDISAAQQRQDAPGGAVVPYVRGYDATGKVIAEDNKPGAPAPSPVCWVSPNGSLIPGLDNRGIPGPSASPRTDTTGCLTATPWS